MMSAQTGLTTLRAIRPRWVLAALILFLPLAGGCVPVKPLPRHALADPTLRDMVARRPKTVDDLHEVYGVGAKKAADFGDAFLDAIRTFRRPE